MLHRLVEPTVPTGQGALRQSTFGGLAVVVQLFLVMMAVGRAKEPPVAGRAAITILKHREVPEPVFDATSSRLEELFAAAIWTARGLRVGSGLLHDKSFGGRVMLQRLAVLVEAEAQAE